MSQAKKTNAMRMLDTAGIAYEQLVYEVDESDLSGTHVAEVLGESPRSVAARLERVRRAAVA